MTTEMKRYWTEDGMGNTHVIIVRGTQVYAYNQNRIAINLAAYSKNSGRGFVVEARAVADAARLGLAELNNASMYTWGE